VIVAVVGSRGWGDLDRIVYEMIDAKALGDSVISGGATGADTMVAATCRKLGVPFREIRPDYEQHGRRAPLVRNQEIAKACDRMIAFWDGKSTGTAHAIGCARRLLKNVKIIPLGHR
jgi:orotate phosphoribosyltransferase